MPRKYIVKVVDFDGVETSYEADECGITAIGYQISQVDESDPSLHHSFIIHPATVKRIETVVLEGTATC